MNLWAIKSCVILWVDHFLAMEKYYMCWIYYAEVIWHNECLSRFLLSFMSLFCPNVLQYQWWMFYGYALWMNNIILLRWISKWRDLFRYVVIPIDLWWMLRYLMNGSVRFENYADKPLVPRSSSLLLENWFRHISLEHLRVRLHPLYRCCRAG